MSIGSGNGLELNRRQDITWTNADLVHWGIYAALGVDELTIFQHLVQMMALCQTLSEPKMVTLLMPICISGPQWVNMNNKLLLLMSAEHKASNKIALRVKTYGLSEEVFHMLFRRSALVYHHYGDVLMSTMSSQITSLTIVYSTVYSDADQRKHQSSASLAFVWGIHRGPVNSPHKWPVTRKMFPFDDVIMIG